MTQKQEGQCLCTSANGNPKSGFPSKDAAEAWFALKQKQYNWEPQRPYQCPTSSVWHLTTNLEERQPQPVRVTLPAVPEPERQRAARGEVHDAVESLLRHDPAIGVAEVVVRLPQYNEPSVRNAYAKLRRSKQMMPATLDTITSRRAQLAAELAKLEAEEKAMRDALTPKVQMFGNNGETQVRLTYNSQSLTFTLEAAQQLSRLLIEKVQ